MNSKFLFFILFCGVTISTFGQVLQSPQISQNAIFANPGLAGSKGQTRVCANFTGIYTNYQIGRSWSTTGNTSTTSRQNNSVGGLISVDGLILKNKLGIAGYVRDESFQLNDTYKFYQNNIQYDTDYIKYHYNNFTAGFMLAPKFQLTAKNINKNDHVLSPALAIGIKTTKFNYSGPGFYNHTTKDSIKDGAQKFTSGLDYISASLIYSSSKSYCGIKLNFKTHQDVFLLYDVSFVYAKTYANKASVNPKFSFTPQFYLTIPTHYVYKQRKLESYFDRLNQDHSNYFLDANFDFRYGKFIFGLFGGWSNNSAFHAGITAGVQLENTKIIINYYPGFSSQTKDLGALFLSANFLLKPKQKSYR
jgi:hypothetical protein